MVDKKGENTESAGDQASGFASKVKKRVLPSPAEAKEKESQNVGFINKVGGRTAGPKDGQEFADCKYCTEKKKYYKIEKRVKVEVRVDSETGTKKKVKVVKRVRVYLTPEQLTIEWTTYQSSITDDVSYETKMKRKMSRYLFTVRGQDREWDAWHIVLVEPGLMQEFKRKIDSGSIDVAKFGKVIYSGWGKDPPEDVMKKVWEEYGPGGPYVPPKKKEEGDDKKEEGDK